MRNTNEKIPVRNFIDKARNVEIHKKKARIKNNKMKTKNLILGFASFVLAIGGAFNAISSAFPDYIHVKYFGDANFTCTTAADCIGGPLACQTRVSVVPLVGPPAIAAVQAYENRLNPTTCVIPLATKINSLLVVSKSRRIIEVKQ